MQLHFFINNLILTGIRICKWLHLLNSIYKVTKAFLQHTLIPSGRENDAIEYVMQTISSMLIHVHF